MKRVDQQARQQWRKLCGIMAERLRKMGAGERHQLMQLQMSKARGPAANLRALCRMSAMLMHTQRRFARTETTDDQ